METDVPRKLVFDGTNWHVEVLDKQIGPMRLAKRDIDIIFKWLNDGALQDMLDVMTNIIEKAFREKEIRQNGK